MSGIQLKVLPQFPAQVVGVAPIIVTKVGLTSTISISGISTNYLGSFLVSTLPVSPIEGNTAFATNGRKVSEGAGFGTGVPVYFSHAAWRVYSTDAPVSA